MAKVTKYYCDRCKKEVEMFGHKVIEIKFPDGCNVMARIICPNCADEFTDWWLGNLAPKEVIND